MRTFFFEMTNSKNFEQRCRVVKVKAVTVKGAMKKARRKKVYLSDGTECDFIYQIATRKKGCELPQPIYDWFNGFRIYC